MTSRREEALALAERTLGDLELGRINPVEAARAAFRIARLLDDSTAVGWLRYETMGYRSSENGLSQDAWAAAKRSGRVVDTSEGARARTESLGALEANIDALRRQIDNPSTPAGYGFGIADRIVASQRIVDGVTGAIHAYLVDRYQELRFGHAVEAAFDEVRSRVDAGIHAIVPDALPRITTAFENAGSGDPEQWRNAAAACRSLLKQVADAVRPPGPDNDGRKMGPDQYINRLAAWIEETQSSKTAGDFTRADLAYLGARLDAAAGAGHKGAHAESVSKYEAARFVAGTYLLLGDVLLIADS